MAISEVFCRAIDRIKPQTIEIGRQIHARPELKFEERLAAKLLGDTLAGLGAEMGRGVGGLETAFRAAVGNAGPTVAILAEYDALPRAIPLRSRTGLASMVASPPGATREPRSP